MPGETNAEKRFIEVAKEMAVGIELIASDLRAVIEQDFIDHEGARHPSWRSQQVSYLVRELTLKWSNLRFDLLINYAAEADLAESGRNARDVGETDEAHVNDGSLGPGEGADDAAIAKAFWGAVPAGASLDWLAEGQTIEFVFAGKTHKLGTYMGKNVRTRMSVDAYLSLLEEQAVAVVAKGSGNNSGTDNHNGL